MKIEQKHFDAMMNGTECKLWNDECTYVIGKLLCLDNNVDHHFESVNKDGDISLNQNSEPLNTETYVKEWFDIATQLHGDGYTQGTHGCLIKEDCLAWHPGMWKSCGKKLSDCHGYNFEPKWLEKRGV